MRKTVIALGIVALSAVAFAQPNNLENTQPRDHRERAQPHVVPQVPQTQPNPHSPHDRALNPQPLPPRDHRVNDRDHRDRDRDFRTDRDHRHWNDRDHRRNYEFHRDRTRELRIGMRKSEVLRLPWWQHPLYVRDQGPFDTYVYADGRFGRCVLNFQFNRLAEIHCD